MRKAQFWESLPGSAVRCGLCAHRCRILPGRRGICGVRENREGTLYSLSWGKLAAAHVDPIEKKPFFHFLPGTLSFSVAASGCNLSCRHCQNAELSQGPREGRGPAGEEVPPESVAAAASAEGCRSLAYTYSEPTVFWEYARDIALQARERGLKNLFVTNGYMTPEALRESAPWLDGANVDLKSFREKFYREVCGGSLAPVLETISLMKELGIWVEVTTLIIPGYNDARAETEELARFLAALGRDIPWHVSAFRPSWRLRDAPPTPAGTLRRIRETGLSAGLRFVYTGNIPGEEGENTFCPSCRALLVRRVGFSVAKNLLRDGACPDCGQAIPGVWA